MNHVKAEMDGNSTNRPWGKSMSLGRVGHMEPVFWSIGVMEGREEERAAFSERSYEREKRLCRRLCELINSDDECQKILLEEQEDRRTTNPKKL